MSYIALQKLRLAARNEGKIKSYESCVDVRAWSHDIGKRDRYLRDWIKRDMPICVLPVCTLASILTIMSCRNRGRVPTRCHPSCHSKLLLESICSSCTVMKECLKNNKEFEKYFREEDIETVHWPCERCLEILKSIKMFWKIVIEKVLKINITKSNEFKNVHHNSIRNVAKEWRKEMVDNALFVKSTTLLYKQSGLNVKKSSSSNKFEINDKYTFRNNKSTETDCRVRNIYIQKDSISLRKKANRCTSTNIKTAETGVDAPDEKENEDTSMKNLEQQYNLQKDEVDRLKNENVALKIELQNVRKNGLKDPSLYDPNSLTTVDNAALVLPNFYNKNTKDIVDSNRAKDIDSEMIITLKNCKNEAFRHVSLLQVLHKTNGRIFNLKENISCCKNKDPMDILNTVQKTFRAIVNREIAIATNTKISKNRDVEIKATFRNLGVSKSAPSCATFSESMQSASFVSVSEGTH